MKKRGQFYLITVVILVALFIAFASTYNFAGKEKTIGIYDLKNELGIEVEKTMEHIAFQKMNDVEAKAIMSEFSDIYINRSGENKNSFFIYGTKLNLSLKGYKANDENISISINSGDYANLSVSSGETFGPIDYPATTNSFGIKVGEVENLFEIEEGQSLYYLIHYKEVGGEYIVLHN